MRYLVLVLVAFASSSAYLTRHALAAATNRIQADLSLDSKEMGWVFSAFAMGYFISQVPGGWLANRFGSRLVFPAISILWSLTSVWTSFAAGLWGMVSSRFFFGNFQAGLVPISARVLRDWLPASRRGIGSALVGAAMSLGGVVTMRETGRLLEAGWDWRTILQIYSLVGIAWAAGFFLIFRTRPEEHPAVNEAELRLIRGDTEAIAPDERHGTAESSSTLPADEEPLLETPSPVEADDLTTATSPPAADAQLQSQDSGGVTRAMLVSLAMWGICLQSFFRAAAYQLLVTFYPKFLSDGYGVSEAEAANASGYALLAVVIGSLCGGAMVDAVLQLTGNRWFSRTGTGIIALAGCGVLTGLAAMGESSSTVILLVSLGALFAGLGNPPAWAATMDVAGKYTAEVMGVMNMAGTAGGVVFPVILGYVIADIEQSGGSWEIVLWITAVTYLLGAASWMIVNPGRPLMDDKPAPAL